MASSRECHDPCFDEYRYVSLCSGGGKNRESDDCCGHVKVAKEKVMDSDDEGIEDEDEMQNASIICMGTESNSQDVSSHLI